MSDFLTYWNRLRSFVPALSPEQDQTYVNDAWRDIRESNDEWTFLFRQEYWLSPASISLTALSVTQFSTTLGLSYAAMVSVANLSNPPITQRQLRFGLSGGPIYEISGTDVQQLTDGAITAATNVFNSPSGPFDPAHVGLKIQVNGAGAAGANLQTTIATFVNPTQVTLTNPAVTTVVGATFTFGSSITLARPYNEVTNANQSALLYRVYYSPIDTTFERLDHLVDSIQGYEFGWEVVSADELDRIDPQRSSVTQPWRVFFHGYNQTTRLPVFEMWPGPTVSRAYTVYYWSRGVDFVDDADALPPPLTEELLLTRARMLAYEWAAMNDVDEKRRGSYTAGLAYVRGRYSTESRPGGALGLLEQAKRRDRDIYMKEFRRASRRTGQSWPIDSNFLQARAFPPYYWNDGW